MKMEAKQTRTHTPGPWIRWRTTTGGTPGTLIGPPGERYVAAVNSATTVNETTANCDLIAAAPDLLEACRASLVAITSSYGVPHKGGCQCRKCYASDKLRAAIAKARG